MTMTADEMAGADISPCGLYRYRLWRRWGPDPQIAWIMLNPSTADASRDDPTIRRVAAFTKRLGGDGFVVVNLFALRATNPVKLVHDPESIGPDNWKALEGVLHGDHKRVIAAWGSAAKLPRGLLLEREDWVRRHVLWNKLACLGTTRAGHPRHPLYVHRNTRLVDWPASDSDQR